jgi:hypothetical protein
MNRLLIVWFFRFHAAVAGDDLLGIVDQGRVTEAKLRDAICDLADLLL